MTKRKVGEKLKEHIRDLKCSNQNTALSRENIKNPLKPHQWKEKKSNYENHHSILMREANEINLKKELYVMTTHTQPLGSCWCSMIDEREKSKGKIRKKWKGQTILKLISFSNETPSFKIKNAFVMRRRNRY